MALDPNTPDGILQMLAPDMVTVVTTVADRAAWLTLAAQELDPAFWATHYNRAMALLAAHQWARLGVAGAGAGSSGGSVTSEKVGQLARSYSSSSGASADSDLESTRYGKAYLRLRAQLGPGIGFVV